MANLISVVWACICPVCGANLNVFPGDDLKLSTFNSTMDCPNCNALLLIDKGTICDFHEKMHEEYAAWPKDGKGAGTLKLEEEKA